LKKTDIIYSFARSYSITADGSLWIADADTVDFQHYQADGAFIGKIKSTL
jgi:hypothetical protein